MDKLFFYSKSRDVPAGKGTNEYTKDPAIYTELKNIPHWRRVLSNFHVYPFVYKGYTYNSIEHVFQSEKIRLVDPVKALYFTLESGHDIGKGDGFLAQNNRKLVKLNSNQLRKWGEMKEEVMKNAAIEKYNVCEEARRVLKATLQAELWHVVMRKKPARFLHLEEIRQTL